jgi:hypothetical protein
MDENTNIDNTVTEATGATVETGNQETNQAQKTFTQEDVDRIIANRLKQVERKYESIDIEEYNQLRAQQEQAKEAEMMKKNQFEELLQKQKNEADARISSLQNELHRVQVDGALLNAASKHKALNPEHVAQLLKNTVRLNESGQVEVIDTDGQVRYDTNTAAPVTVDQAVEEFLAQNVYFRAAAPSGSGSNGNAKHTTASREVSLGELDMSNAEHRKIYAEKFKVGMTRNYKVS